MTTEQAPGPVVVDYPGVTIQPGKVWVLLDHDDLEAYGAYTSEQAAWDRLVEAAVDRAHIRRMSRLINRETWDESIQHEASGFVVLECEVIDDQPIRWALS